MYTFTFSDANLFRTLFYSIYDSNAFKVEMLQFQEWIHIGILLSPTMDSFGIKHEKLGHKYCHTIALNQIYRIELDLECNVYVGSFVGYNDSTHMLHASSAAAIDKQLHIYRER